MSWAGIITGLAALWLAASWLRSKLRLRLDGAQVIARADTVEIPASAMQDRRSHGER